mgnify:CR=1 FL=1
MTTPTTLRKHSKRYRQAATLVDRARSYSPEEAVALVKQLASAAFDETVELHLRTGSDPRRADQLIRGVVILPHGTGKPIRVLVFAQGEAAQAAREAGADFIGDDEVVRRIEEGWTDFDTSIATPDMMGRIGRLGRILGRRGLMPNPRTGTVVPAQDIPRAVQEAKRGRVEFRMDRTAIIHVPVGKASFEPKQLLENIAAVVDAVQKARPQGVRGQYLRSAYLSTTMGPSVKLDVNALTGLRAE